MALVKAKRFNIYPKILLDGASGAGKTYSALSLATGYDTKAGHKGIALVDTENGRANYYADQFDFGVIDDLGAGRNADDKYSPESYIDAIKEAVDAGCSVLVIDSLSHEWQYLNRVHDSMPGNSFQNWRPLKARHTKLFEYILQAPICIIATARSKEEYVLEANDKGKQTVSKKGLAPIQDSQIEYEYTVTWNIAQDTHVAVTTKDNTHLFEGTYRPLTKEDGGRLYDWANSGVTAPKHNDVQSAPVQPATDIATVKQQINAAAGKLYSTHKDQVMSAVKKYAPSGNPNSITDVDVAIKLLNELTAIA